MANRLKKNFALASISARCYTVEDMELMEQFKQTSKYRKWKEDKDKKVKTLSRKKGKKKALEEIYGDYTPEYMKLRISGKPRLRM